MNKITIKRLVLIGSLIILMVLIVSKYINGDESVLPELHLMLPLFLIQLIVLLIVELQHKENERFRLIVEENNRKEEERAIKLKTIIDKF